MSDIKVGDLVRLLPLTADLELIDIARSMGISAYNSKFAGRVAKVLNLYPPYVKTDICDEYFNPSGIWFKSKDVEVVFTI